MFTGGTDTSSTVIEWTMSELMRHPPIMAKVQEEARRVFGGKGAVDETGINELKYMKLVLMESLRLHPPVCLLIRECIESCKIGGYDIPSKTKVLINSWAMSRDPTLWGDDCEVFNPERFLGSSIDYKGAYLQYLPFGSGRRMCPGMLFGMVNVELPLAKLLYYFDWKLPNDMKPQDLDMAEVRGGTTRRKSELVLIPVPRFPINLCVSQM